MRRRPTKRRVGQPRQRDTGQILVGRLLTTLVFLAATRRAEKEVPEDKKDKSLPEQAQIDFEQLYAWLTGLAAAFLACEALIPWVLELVRLTIRAQTAKPGKEKKAGEKGIQDHLKVFFKKVVKVSQKETKNVDDPYHAGNFDVRNCFAISICGKKEFTICFWQDVGVLLPEGMITVTGPDGKEQVIVWWD